VGPRAGLNIKKKDLTGIKYDDVNWIQVPQDMVQKRTSAKMVINREGS
jgi:hypothetical protein